MRKFNLFCEILILSFLSSTFGEPAVGQSKGRGLMELLGLGGGTPTNAVMGPSPCFQATTTTQSPNGLLCPLQQLPPEGGIDSERPFEQNFGPPTVPIPGPPPQGYQPTGGGIDPERPFQQNFGPPTVSFPGPPPQGYQQPGGGIDPGRPFEQNFGPPTVPFPGPPPQGYQQPGGGIDPGRPFEQNFGPPTVPFPGPPPQGYQPTGGGIDPERPFQQNFGPPTVSFPGPPPQGYQQPGGGIDPGRPFEQNFGPPTVPFPGPPPQGYQQPGGGIDPGRPFEQNFGPPTVPFPGPPPQGYQQLPQIPSPPQTPAIPSYPSPPAVPNYPAVPSYPAAPSPPQVPSYPAAPPPPQVPSYPAAPPPPAYPNYPQPPSVPDYPAAPAPPAYPDYPAPPSVPAAPNPPGYPTQPAIPNPPTPPNFPGTGSGTLSFGNPGIIPGQFFPGNPPFNVPGTSGFFVPPQPGQLPTNPGQFFPVEFQPNPMISQPMLPPPQPQEFLPQVFPPRPSPIDPGFPLPPPSPGLLADGSNPVPSLSGGPVAFGPPQQYCSGIPVGPLIPPGFFLANSLLRQQHLNEANTPRGPLPMCNMMEVLQQLRLGTIHALILQAGLEQLFTQTSNYTFFAPVDPAFDKLPAWFMQSLRDDIKLLRSFILNHFIKIEIRLDSLGNEFLVLNARSGGNRLRINVYYEESDYRIYTVDGSRVLVGEMETLNGILHVVDKVLVPTRVRLHSEYLAEIQDFSVFLNTVVDSGLLPVLEDQNSPVTLFIPYNEAFKGFELTAIGNDVQTLQNLVNYHIVNGTYYSNGLLHGQFLTTNYYKEIKMSITSDGFTKFANMINGNVKILKSDIPVRNGVAHIIDTVLTYDINFFTNFEISEFGMEFGTLSRGMTLNKLELEKEFAREDLKSFRELGKSSALKKEKN